MTASGGPGDGPMKTKRIGVLLGGLSAARELSLRSGEAGLAALPELLGIPYTGSDVLPSALAMNKVKAKELFRLHNLPTPPYYVVHRVHAETVAEDHKGFG